MKINRKMKTNRKYFYFKKILCLGLLFEMILANSVAIDPSEGLLSASPGKGVEVAMGTHEPMNNRGNQPSWNRYDDNCEDCEESDSGANQGGYQMNHSMMGGNDMMGGNRRFLGGGVQDYLNQLNDSLGSGFVPTLMGVSVVAIVVALFAAMALLSVALVIPILVIFFLIRIVQTTAEGEKNKTALARGKKGVDLEADYVGKYVYFLYLAGIALPLLWIVGVVVSYVYRDGGSEWTESHFRFQIRTFWIGLLFSAVSGILMMAVIGLFGYIFLLFWVILRSIKGLQLYNQSQPIPNSTTWLW